MMIDDEYVYSSILIKEFDYNDGVSVVSSESTVSDLL